MEKKVQLKEQEIVGQEVVLSDIYPKTDTSSVEDIVSGSSLDLKLDRIVEMINNKLTRVVNSVNSRTGVVTLDADDVGLGNVDNVSFNDIKEWVISTLEEYFGNKRFQLFEKASDMLAIMNTNDSKYDNVGFYVHTWDPSNDDYRSAVGIFQYSTTNKVLSYQEKYLNQIYAIDEASYSNYVLEYNKGILKFNIDSNEDALLIKQPTSDAHGGLAIDHDKLITYLYSYGDLYYIPSEVVDQADVDHSLNGFLREEDVDHPESMRPYEIYINNGKLKQGYYITDDQEADESAAGKNGDIVIISGPADLMYDANPDLKDNTKTSPYLKYHQPMIGNVTVSKNTTGAIKTFQFVTLNPFVTWGLTNHQNFIYNSSNNVPLHSNNTETQIATIGENSGINVLSHPYQLDLTNWKTSDSAYTEHTPSPSMNVKYSPLGEVPIYGTKMGINETANIHKRQGGIFIPADASMCTYSYSDFGKQQASGSTESERSSRVTNWYAPTPFTISDTLLESHDGYLNPPTFVGVNLMKGIKYDTDGTDEINDQEEVAFIPMSGLKVLKSKYADGTDVALTYEDLGMSSKDANDQKRFMSENFTPSDLTYVTGGLMVNVGNGLEIVPTATPTGMSTYTDQGKVSVRTGFGLAFDGHGRLTVDPDQVQTGGGSGLMGIQIVDNNRPGYNTSLFYNLYPTTANPDGVEAYHQITLGDGLGLKLDTNDIRNLILYQMTIVKLSYFESSTFTAKDGSTFTAKNYVDPGDSYIQIINDKLPSFLRLLSDNDLIEFAYRIIKSILDIKENSLSYNSRYVVKSQTINRLFVDECKNGSGTTTAKNMTIETMINNYAERHGIEVGDYKRYADADTAQTRNYDEDVQWVDYSDGNTYPHLSPLFNALDNSQKNLFNAIFNMTFAIRKAVSDKWDTFNGASDWTDIYADGATPTYISPVIYRENGQSTVEMKFTNYRLDTSGIISLFFAALNYNLTGQQPKYSLDNMKFNTESLLNGDKIKEVTNDTLSNDFEYTYNSDDNVNLSYDVLVSDTKIGDVILGMNYMWMILEPPADPENMPTHVLNVYGIDFYTGEKLVKWCDSIERLIDDKTQEYESMGEILGQLFKEVIIGSVPQSKMVGNYNTEKMKMRIRYVGNQ